MMDQFHLTIEVDDDDNDSFPYLLKESYIQRHSSLHDSYKACFDIVKQLTEDEVKDIAKEHRIYYNPIDECNSQRYYNVDWKHDIYPKLQKDVARYFCAKSGGVKDLSKYNNANEEEVAEMEVEVDGMDLETSRTTISNSNNVDKEDEIGGAAVITTTSAVHFKPIANTKNEQDAGMEQLETGIGGDAGDDNLDFGGGGCDGDELDSIHIKEDIQQSTVKVDALDTPKLDIQVLEESNVKEATRNKTKSPTSVNDTAQEQLQEVEQQTKKRKGDENQSQNETARIKTNNNAQFRTLHRLLSPKDTGGRKTSAAVLRYVKQKGITPKNAKANYSEKEHVLRGSEDKFKSQFISTAVNLSSIIDLAKLAVADGDDIKIEDLFIAKIKIEEGGNDYCDLSNTTTLSVTHRRETGVAADYTANKLSASMTEVLLRRPIKPLEIEEIIPVSEVDVTQPQQNTAPTIRRPLPPMHSTLFPNRPAKEVEKYVNVLYDLCNRVDSNLNTHFKGLLNGLKDVENGLDEDGKPTVEALTYLQANLHKEFFSLIAQRGFDIRNCTLDELDELQRKLGTGWSVSEEDLDGDKDETNENVAYIKLVCANKRVLAVILQEIINDPTVTNQERGMARRFLNDMEHKSDDEVHCFWYVGETARSLLKRMKEKYPEILERMGVTHRLQVGQAGESILDWSSKEQVLLLEALVAFMIEGSINRTLQSAAEEKGEQFVPLPLHKIGSANTISCGLVNGACKPGIGLFCKQNCSDDNRFMKVSEVTSDPGILNYVDQYLYPIALVNGYEPNDSYEPTMIELCIATGTFCYESGKGLGNKAKLPIAETDYYRGDKLVTKAGTRYPNYASYTHHMGMGIHLFNKLNRLAVVAEETRPDISNLTLRELKRIPFVGEDKVVYDALSTELQPKVLLKKLKETRQKHNGMTVKVNLDVTSGVDPGFGIYFNPKKGDQYIKFKKVVPQSIAGKCRHISNGKRIKRINGKGYGRCYDTAKVLLQEAYKSGNISLEIFRAYD